MLFCEEKRNFKMKLYHLKKTIFTLAILVVFLLLGIFLGGYGVRQINSFPDTAKHTVLDVESAQVLSEFGFLGRYSTSGSCKGSSEAFDGVTVLNDGGVYKRVYSKKGMDGVERGHFTVIESVKKDGEKGILIVEDLYTDLMSVVSIGLKLERYFEKSGPLLSESYSYRLKNGERYHAADGDWVKGEGPSQVSTIFYRCDN
jgi:hypothetical protein